MYISPTKELRLVDLTDITTSDKGSFQIGNALKNHKGAFKPFGMFHTHDLQRSANLKKPAFSPTYMNGQQGYADDYYGHILHGYYAGGEPALLLSNNRITIYGTIKVNPNCSYRDLDNYILDDNNTLKTIWNKYSSFRNSFINK